MYSFENNGHDKTEYANMNNITLLIELMGNFEKLYNILESLSEVGRMEYFQGLAEYMYEKAPFGKETVDVFIDFLKWQYEDALKFSESVRKDYFIARMLEYFFA